MLCGSFEPFIIPALKKAMEKKNIFSISFFLKLRID
jgi:hypothetical protein